MAEATVYQKDGKTKGTAPLNPEVFEAPVNERLLSLVVTAYAGRQRRGTADTKERAEVRGGGRKPWKQKGTGRARQGSIRAPQWRGGGTVFGPRPRTYGADLSQGIRQKAIISALSLKQKEHNVMLLEDARLNEPKTRELAGVIDALGLSDTRTLFVVGRVDEKLRRASGNLRERFSVRCVSDVNAYHIYRRPKLLIEREALPILEQRALGIRTQDKQTAQKGKTP